MCRKRRLVAVLAIAGVCTLVGGAGNTHAQTGSLSSTLSTALPTTLAIVVAPDTPRPGDTVQLSLSGVIESDRAFITWFVNGEEVVRGIGHKSIGLTVGRAGSAATVEVEVESERGVARASVVIRPATVSIVWEASDSFTPPLYRGKALPATNAAIRLLALPEFVDEDGSLYDAADVIYTWKENGRVVAQGYGRQTLDMRLPRFPSVPLSVSVEAETFDARMKGTASLDLLAAKPAILVYEDHPLLGLRFDRVVSDGHVLSGETTFAAFPFFLSVAARESGDIEYVWSVESANQRFSENAPSLTLRPEDGARGRVNIEISARHLTQFIQFASVQFSALFGEEVGAESGFLR
jgi:hypothetical protein